MRRAILFVAVLGLILAACGDDGGSGVDCHPVMSQADDTIVLYPMASCPDPTGLAYSEGKIECVGLYPEPVLDLPEWIELVSYAAADGKLVYGLIAHGCETCPPDGICGTVQIGGRTWKVQVYR